MPKLTIVIGSTRPGRVGLPISQWFAERAEAHGAFEIEIADLAQINLPLLDEPNHPRLRQYTKPHTIAWSERVEGSDAFVFVTPEYNNGYPAALKNAFDYLNHEWRHKAVGFVSYGAVAGGTRAVQQFKQVVATLDMVPLFDAVIIPFVAKLIEDGKFQPHGALDQAADQMLDGLARMERVLRPLREPVAAG